MEMLQKKSRRVYKVMDWVLRLTPEVWWDKIYDPVYNFLCLVYNFNDKDLTGEE